MSAFRRAFGTVEYTSHAVLLTTILQSTGLEVKLVM